MPRYRVYTGTGQNGSSYSVRMGGSGLSGTLLGTAEYDESFVSFYLPNGDEISYNGFDSDLMSEGGGIVFSLINSGDDLQGYCLLKDGTHLSAGHSEFAFWQTVQDMADDIDTIFLYDKTDVADDYMAITDDINEHDSPNDPNLWANTYANYADPTVTVVNQNGHFVFYYGALVQSVAESSSFAPYFPDIVSAQSVPVSTGGSFVLTNGDILTINAEGDPFETVWGDEIDGIGMTLDSGHEFVSFLICETENAFLETGYGTFYDVDYLYEEGNVIRVYDCGDDLYGDEGNYDEDQVSKRATLVATLSLQNGEWVLLTGADQFGQSFTLSNGETLWISGLAAVCDGPGFYYTRSSGETSFAYYESYGSVVLETCSEWFGLFEEPHLDDRIRIYDGDIYEAITDENYMDEQQAQANADLLAELAYGEDGKWHIIEGD